MTLPLHETLLYQQCKDGWYKIATTAMFWDKPAIGGECTGAHIVGQMLRVFGREHVEPIALYWHEHGRDDIAARIKQLIHQGVENKP